MVQAHDCSAGDGMVAYVAGSVPYSHQAGPLAMATQVLSGSAAWVHVTNATGAAPIDMVVKGAGRLCHEKERFSIEPW